MKTLEVIESYGHLRNHIVDFIMSRITSDDLKKADTEINVDYNNTTELAIVCLRRPENHEIRELFQIPYEELDEFVENKKNVEFSPDGAAAEHDAERARLIALSESPDEAPSVEPQSD